MSYIQRLFDGAAGSPSFAAPGPCAPRHAMSPVIAADQRLALFPSLVREFAAEPVSNDPGRLEPQTNKPALRAGQKLRQDTVADQRGTVTNSAPKQDAGTIAQQASPPGRGARPSALQRMVEQDPLQAPASRTTGAPVRAAPEPAQPRADERPRPAPVPDSSLAALGSSARAATPDAPAANSAVPKPPATHPSAPAVRPLEPGQATVARSPAADRAPLFPDQHAQMLTGWLDALQAPPIREEQAAERQPERIIERIREIPVAASPPLRAMTAAGQSVIGSLADRSGASWSPWQEWL